jgi:hypothetical protein
MGLPLHGPPTRLWLHDRAYELAVGVLTLKGGKAALTDLAGAIVYHLGLMLFGFGTWLYCVTATMLLALILRAQARTVRYRVLE